MTTSSFTSVGNYLRRLRGSTPRNVFIQIDPPNNTRTWISEAALCRIENGQAQPTLNTIHMISQRAHVHLEEVFANIAQRLEAGLPDSPLGGSPQTMPAQVWRVFDELFTYVDDPEPDNYIVDQWNNKIGEAWLTANELEQRRTHRVTPSPEDWFAIAYVCTADIPGDSPEDVFNRVCYACEEWARINEDE